MKYVDRELEKPLLRAAKAFPAIVLTGPRRTGKTWLLRHLFPHAGYFLLEDPAIVARLRADPHGFLDEIRLPVILDEVQHVPEIFAHVRSRIDAAPRRVGQWFLTGSQESPLMQRVTESMAGRAALLQLRPFSTRECPKVNVLRGGYPEVIARPRAAALWFSSFIQTYLERDIRAITAVRDLATFRRFLGLLASRNGQVLNKSDLAAPMGVSIPTIGHWLNVLEMTAQILVVPPYFENFGKRLIKSPKVYIADSGLACHLLGIESAAELARSPFAGSVFEGFIASELIKLQVNAGQRPELYHFRDEQGLEVDFLFPGRDGSVDLIECKSGRTVYPAMASPMRRLAESLTRKSRRRGLRMTIVHAPSKSSSPTEIVAPGVRAVAWPEFLNRMATERQNPRHR